MTAANLTYSRLGWRPFFDEQLTASDQALIRARVTRQDVNRYHLLTPQGPCLGVLRGKARLDAQARAALPVVGDWVLCNPAGQGDDTSLVIEKTLTRFSRFSRKEAGERQEEQVVAANIDTVFIVTGLDDNFNVKRIERYLLLAASSGAAPVIVLTKVDLCQDLEQKLEQLAPIAGDTPVVVVSSIENTGIAELDRFVEPGHTVALLGSSGVGKSTLINALLGYEHFKTGEVREGDSKGRHTTTFRELCVTDGGGMLIDTPGMREIQVWLDEDELAANYDDIEDLALQCRFRDCRHDSEPGCAVMAAIDRGELDPARLASYRQFEQEVAALASKSGRGTRRKPRK